MSTNASPARSLAARNVLMLLALAPGLALQGWREPSLPGAMALAFAGALVLEALALAIRRQPLAPFLREGSAPLYAVVLVAWLPALAAWQLLLALFVALLLARQAFGGLGRNLFHPVAVGVAFAQLCELVPTTPATPDRLLACAWLAGGLLLLALRIVRWQSPLFLLVGALTGLLLAGRTVVALADPRWALAAFFIATDGVTTPEDGRMRTLAAACAGVLAGLAGTAAPAVLPFALLAMNIAAPVLDAWHPPRRKQAAGA